MITARIANGWQIYAQSQPQGDGAPQPTKIVLDDSPGFNLTSDFRPDPQPTITNSEFVNVPIHELHGDVTWRADIKFAEDVDVANVNIAGGITGQICKTVCVPLFAKDNRFVANYAGPIPAEQANPTPVDMSAKHAVPRNDPASAVAGVRLVKYVGLGFLAGLILNFMPCVLPVIGLKVMSFVNQAGENRARILLLNVAFSLGLLSVFMVLATASALGGMAWGAYLTESMLGSVLIMSFVFAFALSMLGVWEFPIPGLSGGADKLAHQEGPAGAFFLGIFTTVLATPCTGPFLGSALGVTAGQGAWVSYLIFASIGLGMASPYLLVGLNPKWIGWLPKPGVWMELFKQVMGFVLMATVIFLLSSFGREPRNKYLVPVLTVLLGVGVACWWIGRTSLAAGLIDKAKAWTVALGIVAVGALVGFGVCGPPRFELDWQKFTAASLDELRTEDKVVFVDFTGPG